jgi:molecular chaperone DnaK (HSP70)
VKTVDGKKELPALTIFSMAIKFLKDHLTTTLDKRDTGVRPDDIQWVLTVPAIWNDPAKQFMREAAEKVKKYLIYFIQTKCNNKSIFYLQKMQ